MDYWRHTQFRIGDVVVRSWWILARHFITFSFLTGAALLPRLLLMRAGAEFISVVSEMIFGTFAQAIVTFAVFEALRGRRVSAEASLAHGLARFVPAILVALVFTVIFLIGLICLVVPGLMAVAAYAVAIPVCVVERAGVGTSLSRSAKLTKGQRWPIVAIFLAYIFIDLVISAAIRVALPEGPAAVVEWLWKVLTSAYSAVYGAILYHDLRSVKEGIGIEEIASVFD